MQNILNVAGEVRQHVLDSRDISRVRRGGSRRRRIWQAGGTEGEEKQEAKKSFRIAAFSTGEETCLAPSERDERVLVEVVDRL